jgi:transposase
MGQAIAVRTDYSNSEVRRLAQRAKDAGQARRLLAIAAVLDGSSREEAARVGGMDRQTLRDWVIRFNEQGPEGLINIPSPGAPAKLTTEHKAFLARLVEEGPIPAPGLEIVVGQASAHGLARQALVRGQFDHLAGEQLQRPARTAPRRVRAGGRHQQSFLLAGEFALGAGPRLLAQRSCGSCD